MASVASVIAPLNPAPLEPYAYGKAGVQVVIDLQDATHYLPPLRHRTRSTCLISQPLKKSDGLPPQSRGHFALRISTVPYFCRKSPGCLPSYSV